jgi:hypothetical protein
MCVDIYLIPLDQSQVTKTNGILLLTNPLTIYFLREIRAMVYDYHRDWHTLKEKSGVLSLPVS